MLITIWWPTSESFVNYQLRTNAIKHFFLGDHLQL